MRKNGRREGRRVGIPSFEIRNLRTHYIFSLEIIGHPRVPVR